MISKLTIALGTSAALTSVALAGNPHMSGATGQPNQSCENPQTMTMPGHSASARGSAFNPNGIAGMNYAGEKQSTRKTRNRFRSTTSLVFKIRPEWLGKPPGHRPGTDAES